MICRMIAMMCLLAACPKPGPGPGQPPAPGVVQCSADAVQKCAAQALPAVNECLSGQGDITVCLIGLIQPAGCITYEVVVCLTRHEGAASMHAFEENVNDSRDAWRANRAREFLDKQQVRFDD